MDGIEYIFGSGDGAYETWTTPADLDLDADGVLDAVVLDFDGDGLRDDALWDSDLDGVADMVAVDLEPSAAAGDPLVGDPLAGDTPAVDGRTQWHTDPAGDGTWSGYQVAEQIPAPEPVPRQPGPTEPGTPAIRAGSPTVVADPAPGVLVDANGDGILDTALSDADGDGLLDTASPADVRLRAGDWSAWGVTRR